jgi:hypothetical protein
MADDFLRRWSRRKHEHAAEAEKLQPVEKKDEAEAKPAAPLPPVEDLTPESDFTGFMQPKVEDSLRRAALKKLFRGDPHFNIPDPFEPYSRDWNIADPIPPEMLATLNQAKVLLFDKKEEEPKAEEKIGEKVEHQGDEQIVAKAERKKPDESGRQDT